MAVSKLSMDYETKTMKEIKQIRIKQFWSKNLLNNREKRSFFRNIRFFVFLHFLLWCLALTAALMLNEMPNVFPIFFFNKKLPFWGEIIYKICMYMFIFFGYYVGNAHECYFAYNILQTYFQMTILISYIRSGMGEYKKLKLVEKIRSETYQEQAREIFQRSIRHYNCLKTFIITVLGVYLGTTYFFL